MDIAIRLEHKWILEEHEQLEINESLMGLMLENPVVHDQSSSLALEREWCSLPYPKNGPVSSSRLTNTV
jgi:hypothetical protein